MFVVIGRLLESRRALIGILAMAGAMARPLLPQVPDPVWETGGKLAVLLIALFTAEDAGAQLGAGAPPGEGFVLKLPILSPLSDLAHSRKVWLAAIALIVQIVTTMLPGADPALGGALSDWLTAIMAAYGVTDTAMRARGVIREGNRYRQLPSYNASAAKR